MSRSPPRVGFSVKLPLDDYGFLKALRAQRRLKVLGDSLRILVSAARTLYALPPYQAARVRLDMETRGLDVVTYVQELIAKRYETLALEDAAHAARPLTSTSRTNGTGAER